jgi:hypothetical protein
MEPIARSGSLSLIIEPEQLNIHSVVDAMQSAQHSLWIEVYELSSQDVLSALTSVRNKGTASIQVMIDPQFDHTGRDLAALKRLTLPGFFYFSSYEILFLRPVARRAGFDLLVAFVFRFLFLWDAIRSRDFARGDGF